MSVERSVWYYFCEEHGTEILLPVKVHTTSNKQVHNMQAKQ